MGFHLFRLRKFDFDGWLFDKMGHWVLIVHLKMTGIGQVEAFSIEIEIIKLESLKRDFLSGEDRVIS